MKKNVVLTFIALWSVISFSNVHAQNMVLNPSFEIYNACPVNAMINLSYDFPLNEPTVKNWFLANGGTSDYYNSCANPANLGMPNNWVGRQNARTGQGMAGIIFYDLQELTNDEYAEYLQGQLATPMISGHVYYGSYWVSLAELNSTMIPFNYGSLAIDQLSAHFSVTDIAGVGTSILNLSPDISSPPGVYYTDTAVWKKVEGFYTATGGEKWITIGSFQPYANQSSVCVVTNSAAMDSISYYYVDDICVYDISVNNNISSFDTVICNGTSNFIDIKGKSNATSWHWNTGATTQHISATSGTYWVQSYGECEAWIDTFHVAANAVKLGNDTLICGGQLATIGVEQNPSQTYLWNTGATTSTITVSNSGQYFLTIYSLNCPPVADTIEVAFAPKPPKLPDYDTLICSNQGGMFQIPIIGNGLIWHNTPTDSGSRQAPVIDKSSYGSSVFYVQQSDSCYSDLSKVTINVLPQPYANLNDTTFCNEEAIDIFLGEPQPFVDFAWNTGSDSCCIIANKSGIYSLKAYNECGEATDESKVFITPCDNCLMMPNAFSPNLDGVNEIFEPMYACAFRSYAFSIYNRFGQRVFFSQNSQKGWDGYFNGEKCDAGTYFYYIEVTLLNPEGKKSYLKGDVELIR